jgi:hypothetical protein
VLLDVVDQAEIDDVSHVQEFSPGSFVPSNFVTIESRLAQV